MKRQVNSTLLGRPSNQLFNFVTIFAVIGVVMLIISYAATFTADFEPESGTALGVSRQIDNSASGSAYILFGGNTVVTAPTSITSDCSVNVSGAMQTWINSVPDGRTLRFTEAACYRIDQTISLTDRSNLTIDGNGATFKTSDPTGDSSTLTTPSKAARNRAHWRSVRGSNIIFRNMTIIGANPAGGTGTAAYVVSLEAQHGFDILGTQGVEIDHATLSDMYGDCVYVGISGDVWSSDVVFHDSRCERNGRMGVAVTAGRRVTVRNNYIGAIRHSSIDLEPNGGAWGVDTVLVTDNTFGPGRLNFLAAHGTGQVDNVTVSNNQLIGRAMNSSIKGSTTYPRTNFVIENNTSASGYGNPSGGIISFNTANGVRVSNNTQPAESGRSMYLVSFTSTSGIVVKGNTVANGIGAARLDLLSQALEICGNRLSLNGAFDVPVVCP